MSVTSLRRIFRYPDLEHDDATRVVVINQGIPVGLVVDRMGAVVTAEADQIESVGAIEGTINTELLRGMIKAPDGHGMIMILDPVRLVAKEFGSGGRGAERQRTGHAEAKAERPAAAAEELQLVSFEVAGQEYALAIENVQEIVQVPTRINRVPKTDPHVLGVMTLRNRLLPLVSLREMFGLGAMPLDDRNKIVVVPLPDHTSVGIVMDQGQGSAAGEPQPVRSCPAADAGWPSPRRHPGHLPDERRQAAGVGAVGGRAVRQRDGPQGSRGGGE